LALADQQMPVVPAPVLVLLPIPDMPFKAGSREPYRRTTPMIEISEDYRQLDRLATGIEHYEQASKHTLAFSIVSKARDLSYDLYKETKKITPSEAALRELAGTTAGKKLLKNGRPKPGLWAIKRNSGSVKDEIARRILTRFYTAKGWFPAIQAFRGKPRGQVSTVIKKVGSLIAEVDQTSGWASIRITNMTAVARTQIEKHGIIGKAVGAVLADIAEYIGKNLGGEARKSFEQI
jgi:hypothetical protein